MLTAAIGKALIPHICGKMLCTLPSIEYLGFRGLLKTLGTECSQIHVPGLERNYVINVNGIRVNISPLSRERKGTVKEINYYPSIRKLSFNRVMYEAEIGSYMRNVVKVLKTIIRRYSLKGEGESLVSFIPWEHSKYVVTGRYIKVFYIPSLGVYSLKDNVEKISLKTILGNTISSTSFSMSIRNTREIHISYKGYEWIFHMRESIRKVLGDEDRGYIFIKLNGSKNYVLLTPSMELHMECNGFQVETDHEGGLLTWFTLFTVLEEKINYNEDFDVYGPLWFDYASLDHGIGVCTKGKVHAKISGCRILFSEGRGLTVKIHRGLWKEGGVGSSCIQSMIALRKMRIGLKKSITLIKLVPKHVIPLGIRVRNNIVTLELFNLSTEPILSRIRIPWKIENVYKVSILSERILDDVSYDYNIVYLPLTANEYTKLKIRISPIIILR